MAGNINISTGATCIGPTVSGGADPTSIDTGAGWDGLREPSARLVA